MVNKRKKLLLYSQEQLIGYFRCEFACIIVFLFGVFVVGFLQCVECLGSCRNGETKEIAFS